VGIGKEFLMTQDTYNGWTNRETWAVNLWLSNDHGLYLQTEELAQQAASEADARLWLASRLEDMVSDLFEGFYADPEGSQGLSGFVSDVGSLWRVDWAGIARAWIDERELQDA
jgi:hypothetical protein